MAQAESIPDEWLRQSLLASLAKHLPRPALERAVDLARRLHGTPRALALAELGHALPDRDRRCERTHWPKRAAWLSRPNERKR